LGIGCSSSAYELAGETDWAGAALGAPAPAAVGAETSAAAAPATIVAFFILVSMLQLLAAKPPKSLAAITRSRAPLVQ
jgi:hypothetical protein